jgi:hypothetical protein
VQGGPYYTSKQLAVDVRAVSLLPDVAGWSQPVSIIPNLNSTLNHVPVRMQMWLLSFRPWQHDRAEPREQWESQLHGYFRNMLLHEELPKKIEITESSFATQLS